MIPILFAGVAGLLVLLNMFLKANGSKKAMLLFNVTALSSLVALTFIGGSGPHSYLNLVSANPMSVLVAQALTVAAILVSVLAYANSDAYDDFAVLASFSLLGMYFAVFAASLMTTFVGLELMTVPIVFTALISKRQGVGAASRLFFISSLAIAVMAFSISLVYGSAGTLTLSGPLGGALIPFAAALFMIAISFYAFSLPLNMMTADICEHGGACASAMLSMGKTVGLAVLLQVMSLTFYMSGYSSGIVAAVAAVTMMYGNLAASVQRNLKRMVAYSAMAESGFVMIGIAAATQEGISGSLFQMMAQTFIFIGMLAIIAWLERANRTTVDDVIGLAGQSRGAAIALSLLMLATVGLPFTTGFAGKFMILMGAMKSGMSWLVAVGIAGCAISAIYYSKVITAMFTGRADSRRSHLDAATLFVALACVALTLIFGIYPGPAAAAANNAAGYITGLVVSAVRT